MNKRLVVQSVETEEYYVVMPGGLGYMLTYDYCYGGRVWTADDLMGDLHEVGYFTNNEIEAIFT